MAGLAQPYAAVFDRTPYTPAWAVGVALGLLHPLAAGTLLAELAQQRAEAERFKASFAQHFDRARTASIDKSNYVELNRQTIDLVKPFIDWKHRMSEAQAKGKMRSLVWPDFFDHTALEAERFTKRLEQFSRGNAGLDRSEIVNFWAKIMEDHAEFIAHLLTRRKRR